MASTVSSMICCTSTVGVGSSWPATSGTGVADGGGTAAIRGGGFSGVEVNNHSTRSAIIHITRIDVRIARRRRIGTDHITTLLAFDERFGDGGDASLCGVDDGGLVAPLIGCTGAGCAWGICRSPGPVVGRTVGAAEVVAGDGAVPTKPSAPRLNGLSFTAQSRADWRRIEISRIERYPPS